MFITDLADAARESGLPVVEVGGWRTRGQGGMWGIRAVVAHHTATSRNAKGDYPTLAIVRDGHSGLRGTLAQLGLGRSGTVYVIAAGLCWHAGQVVIPNAANEYAIGIEAEHDGVSPWTDVQYNAYVALCSALTRHYEVPVYGHKEVNKVDGKIDPTFDMNEFRAYVNAWTPDKEGLTVSDIQEIIARLGKIEAVLSDRNPLGLQASIQKMANSLAAKQDKAAADQALIGPVVVDAIREAGITGPGGGPLTDADAQLVRDAIGKALTGLRVSVAQDEKEEGKA